MSEVAKVERTMPAPTGEAEPLLAMIERAARDPAVDIDKMRDLMAMRKQIIADANEQAFNNAMAEAQGAMQAVARDANNPQTKSRYASYFALDKAVRPIYTQHGFALSFNTEEGGPAEHIRVVCYVTCAGHTRKYHVDMPADGKGAKGGDVMTKTHATGAAMTYGQRYLLKMIFNMATGDDTDGNAPQSTGPISAEQVAELRTFMKSIGADEAKVLAYVTKKTGTEPAALDAIPAAVFADVKQALKNWANSK